MRRPPSRPFVVLALLVTVGGALLTAQRSPSQSQSPRILGADAVPDIIVSPGTGGQPTQVLAGDTLASLGAGFPFGAGFGTSVRTAVGELSGDGVADIVVAMGPGGGLVRLYDGQTIGEIASGFPFGGDFAGGVSLATGDVNGDGRVDIIVAQASGGGTLRVFSGTDIALLQSVTPFGPSYGGGLNVAAGDVDGDGRSDIVVGQAQGGTVAIVSGASGEVLASGVPYGDLPGGVFVAAGDTTGDGRAEVMAAPGTGPSPVIVYDVSTASVVASFAPYAVAPGGTRLAATDTNNDGRADIFTVPGPGTPAVLHVYDGASFALRSSHEVYGAGYLGGAFISAEPHVWPVTFTSAASTTFVVNSAGSFTVQLEGSPPVTITTTDRLPQGVTFTSAGNGQGTLSGTPLVGSGGVHPLTFRAGATTQAFTLTVNEAPLITSQASVAFAIGLTRTFTVTTNGYPRPSVSLSGLLPAGLGWVPNDDGTLTISGTAAAGSAGSYPVTITASNGLGPPASQGLSIVVAEASDARDETFSNGVGNTQYSVGAGTPSTPAVVISGSVLDNDSGVAPLSAGPAAITTANGGQVVMATNGTFLYSPAAGFAGPSDSFTYSLIDGSGAVDTAVVTLTMSGVVWYVNAATNGDGRSHAPFSNMAAASLAALPGHIIYVHQGAPSGATVLKDNQTLWGAGATFAINAMAIPATTAPTLSGTITLANGVLVRSLRVNGGSGPALSATGLGGNEIVTDVSIDGGSTGLNLANVGGSLAMNGGAITGVAGTDVSVNGGTGALSIGATITSAVGRVVDIRNRSGGSVIFTGAIVDTGGGVHLEANAGSTVAFSGGLDVNVDVADAFTAIGGGTVTATQNNTSIVNSLASASGHALRVVGTEIGSAGLTFRRIAAGNANYSSGNGIVLDGTGTAGGNGGLTVVGNGTAASGGVIRRKSGADGSISSGLAIYLNATKTPTFRRMEISDVANGAIVGRNVAGLTMEDSRIEGQVGTTASEGALVFGAPNPSGQNGLIGTGLLRNVVIEGASGHTAAFYNQSGAMSLQIEGTTRINCGLGSNSATLGGDGLVLLAQGSATVTTVVNNCQFRGNRHAGIRAYAEDDSTLTLSVGLTDVHRLAGVGTEGIVVRNADNAALTASISQSSFYALPGASLWMGQEPFNASANSLLRVTVTNNEDFTQEPDATSPPWVVELSSTPGQAAQSRLLFNNGVTRLVVSRNSEALRVSTPHPGTSPAGDITLLDNHTDTVEVAGLPPSSAVITASQPGATLCTRIAGNTFHWEPPAVGGPLRVQQSGGATFRLERGVSPLATPAGAVLSANNPQSLNQVVGAIAVVENGTCQVP